MTPVQSNRRIAEAIEALTQFGLPKAQLNERSALTLLALLDITPSHEWADASAPLRGVTPIMQFMEEHYGKKYAPNTRETVRRFSLHQMIDAGIVTKNPDDLARPVNSPDNVYQIEQGALEVLRRFGSHEWPDARDVYLATTGTLKSKYAQTRHMVKIPIRLSDERSIYLSPGGQNVLVKLIMEEFAPRFAPGSKVLYLGDTDEKFLHIDRDAFSALDIAIDDHGKMPDLVLHDEERKWLFLVEAVTSHGPVNPKRHAELKALFKTSKAGLVFVTAFATRRAMVKYLEEISYETEVWTADAPSHMIHFDGDRFLGPFAET